MAVPPSLDGLCHRWELRRRGDPMETASSFLQPAEGADGPAMLKCLKPESDERRAAEILAWYDGDASVRLLRSDRGAQLLEWIDGAPLSSLVLTGRDDEATEVLATVAGSLQEPRPGPLPDLESLEARLAPLLAQSADTAVHHGRAGNLAGQLLATTRDHRPLHGDLHHDNVLRHSGRGWLAIDPKGLIGDRHYDLANVLFNPIHCPDVVSAPGRLQRMAQILSARLSLDLDRLLSFAYCHAHLGEIWCEEDGEDPAYWRAMTELIAGIYSQG